MNWLKRKQTNQIVAQPEVETTTSALRKQVLYTQAKYFSNQAQTVLAQASIKVKPLAIEVGPRYLSVGFRLADATQLQKAIGLSNSVGYAAGLGDGSPEPPVIAVPIGFLLHYQFQLPKAVSYKGQKIVLWQDVYTTDPRLNGIGVGLSAGSIPVNFTWDDAPHALVAGITDAGKSTLMTTMLYRLIETYGPEQLKIGIIDPNRDYEAFDNQINLIGPIARTADEIQNMLRYFQQELFVRTQANNRDDTRWLLVMDEADRQHVLGDKENMRNALEIGNGGRAFGVNLLVGTHKPDSDSIGKLRDALDNRFLGKVVSASTSGQLGAGLDLHKLTPRGDFVHAARSRSSRFVAARVPRTMLARMHKGEIATLPHLEPTQNDPTPGRPMVEVDPAKVAYYLWQGTDRVTYSQANELLGLSLTGHNKHKDFSTSVANEYKRLSEEQ